MLCEKLKLLFTNTYTTFTKLQTHRPYLLNRSLERVLADQCWRCWTCDCGAVIAFSISGYAMLSDLCILRLVVGGVLYPHVQLLGARFSRKRQSLYFKQFPMLPCWVDNLCAHSVDMPSNRLWAVWTGTFERAEPTNHIYRRSSEQVMSIKAGRHGPVSILAVVHSPERSSFRSSNDLQSLGPPLPTKCGVPFLLAKQSVGPWSLPSTERGTKPALGSLLKT